MTYKINSVKILQPTAGRWLRRRQLGISGENRPVYQAPREFELKWDLMPISDFNQIFEDYLADSATGTVTVDLPDVEASSYVFRTFSGCHLDEPQAGDYFQEHRSNVVLIVRNINT